MKRKSIIVAAALAATAGAAALAFDLPSYAQPYGGGWGNMGPGMMGGYGPGWMHGGYGPGWMMGGYGPGSRSSYGPGWCWRNYGPGAQTGQATPAPQQQDLKLTTDDVKARMERWLTRQDNPRLKLGDVKEKDADTVTADIVTVDNSLVQRFDIDRHTGATRPDRS